MVDLALLRFIGSVVGDGALAVVFAIFLFLAVRHNLADVPRFSTFKFWVSVAIIIWLVGEVFFGLVAEPGNIIHWISMMLFPLIISVKAYTSFWRKR